MRHARHDVLLAVQDAVERHTRDGASPKALWPSLDALGNLARAEGMPPKQLIIELKQTLNQMPVLAALEPLARSDISARVVLLAIDAYFGDSANGAQMMLQRITVVSL